MVVALGALAAARETTNDTSLSDQHSIFAIKHYQKALMVLRNSLAESFKVRTGK